MKSGTYRLETKYAVTGADISTIDLYVNGTKVVTPTFTQTATLSDWAVNQQTINLNAGANTIEFKANGAGASSLYFDNIVVVPTVVTQANTTNPFTVKVADNGSPSLSATQSYIVTVSPLTHPRIATVTLSGGQLVLQVNGDSGPDYQIQTSTNLMDWSVLFTTNATPMPFSWTNTNTGLSMSFFRIQAGPPF